jgi:uncharacterized membrane protein
MKKKSETTSRWLIRVFRKNFLSGMLVVIPLAIAVWVLYWIFSSVDNLLQPLINAAFGRHIPGLGFAIFLVVIYLVGIIASNYLGKKLIHYFESLITKVPVFRQLYIGAKQVVEGLSGTGMNKAAFREVVFVEFPREGMKTLAFITNEITDKSGKKLYALYIPTAPVPTSGYFEMVTEDKIMRTNITIDEAMKTVISSGMILPEEVTIGNKVAKAPQSIVDAISSTPEPEGPTHKEHS